MKDKKIRVAMVMNDMNINGISTVVMNYCEYLDKSQFDVAIITGEPVNEFYVKKCAEQNVSLIRMPARRERPIRFYTNLFIHLKKNKYDIVHIHGNSAMITPELFLAWMCGIRYRIAHVHNSTCSNIKAHQILLPLFNQLYTDGFACSTLAGEWLFKKKQFTVIYNGFEIEKFRFNEEKRNSLRKKYALEDSFVIGNVARFNDAKNHPFLLEIFESIAKQNERAKLVLLGAGPNLESVKKKIKCSEFRDRIIYLGEKTEVNDYYNLMDVFVLPSKYEGLGIVFVEAQINGLPVVTSDRVPREVDIEKMTKFLSLNSSKEYWAKVIQNIQPVNRADFYEDNLDKINLYNIRMNALKLGNYYKNMVKK